MNKPNLYRLNQATSDAVRMRVSQVATESNSEMEIRPEFLGRRVEIKASGSRHVFHRIHIIGGPGSGKTALARYLGECLRIPVYALDEIAFEGIEFNKRPLEVRLARVHQIASISAWLTEGIHVGWTEELLGNAQLIIWLDWVNWQTAVRRIVFRFAKGSLEEVKHQRGIKKFARFRDYARNLSLLGDSVRAGRAYYISQVVTSISGELVASHIATEQCLAPYQGKVLHCLKTDELDAFLEDLL